jgi:hypothetical protein
MKTSLLALFICLFVVGCTGSPRVGPEFEAGRLHAYDYAKKDAWDFDCWFYPRHLRAAFKAREYTRMLAGQDKSDMFIEGFYFGYERTYVDQVKVKCQE